MPMAPPPASAAISERPALSTIARLTSCSFMILFLCCVYCSVLILSDKIPDSFFNTFFQLHFASQPSIFFCFGGVGKISFHIPPAVVVPVEPSWQYCAFQSPGNEVRNFANRALNARGNLKNFTPTFFPYQPYRLNEIININKITGLSAISIDFDNSPFIACRINLPPRSTFLGSGSIDISESQTDRINAESPEISRAVSFTGKRLLAP
ncbi:MAG: hypothetical protein R2874_12335 [Desulfobacterales bacterium]